MTQITINILDPVHCQTDKQGTVLLKPCLSVDKDFYVQGRFRKHHKISKKYLIGKDGVFLTGFLKRVVEFCNHNNIKAEIVGYSNLLGVKPETQIPQLPGISFRDDQVRLIQAAVSRQRGVLLAPTGTGKTLVALGVASCYPRAFLLFIVHTTDLMRQTYEEFKTFGFTSVGRMGGGDKHFHKQITIATRQTFIKFINKFPDFSKRYDIIIVDECHHISSMDGQYADILQRLVAPVRLGLTATLPYLPEAKMALEGYLGPVIGELTMEEAREASILADIKVKLIKVPLDRETKEKRVYKDVYQEGVVKNRTRNRLVLKTAKDYINLGQVVLIFVTKVEHGKILQEMAFNMFGINAVFIWGDTPKEARDTARHKMRGKKLECAIATVVWKEGINIPALGVIINAAGGKSEIAALQSAGRGLRLHKDKELVTLVDFFDISHQYLIRHSGERVCLYMDENWM